MAIFDYLTLGYFWLFQIIFYYFILLLVILAYCILAYFQLL
jgi:hypothetical protein